MQNPLLQKKTLPLFQQIKPEHALPAIETVINESKATIKQLTQSETINWDSIIQPMEDLSNKLENAWSPVRHLNNVCNSETLRKHYQACIQLISEYSSELGQNETLYNLYQQIHKSADFSSYTQTKQKIITDALLHFKLAGVGLSDEKKKRYRDIQQRLTELTTTFENNVLDATDGWYHHLLDETQLAGLPEHAIYAAHETAKKRQLTGWVFTLEFPSYYAVITYADARELRELLYTAYTTRASDQGDNAGKWDNTPIINEILALRHELAQLLGYANYAELSLATKMVKSTNEVMNFLLNLQEKVHDKAVAEMNTLKSFARENYQIDEIAAWDVAYLSEKLKQQSYQIDNEALRPYFPEDKVVSGLFAIVNKLYGIKVQYAPEIKTWHTDAKAYQIMNEDNRIIATFYFDLYARENKRGGAWMDDCRARHQDANGYLQLPAAYLTCNFTKPQASKPALFTHEEVLTLFHEFGHGLHHMLTQIDSISVSGINGVEWDAVELPSQFMENFCWEREALDLISGHYQTGEPIPDTLYQKMLNAKNYHSAMFTVRQLEFSLFDFQLHQDYQPENNFSVQKILDTVRRKVSVVPVPDFNRFQHSFSHIFAGGYAAGYYSYKWAEILSSDAYSLFEEKGIFSPEVGKAFWQEILSQGGSKPANELFNAFRGREPSIQAYLKHNGLDQ
ncbi:MAG: oligopeptidase A [Legionellales bacterium]|nr:oligopeptidase A [Legionellales bacterium]